MAIQVDRDELVKKLHPSRFPGMSSKMAAIVGYFIGEVYTNPAIVGLYVTVDGHCLAQSEGEVGYNVYVGVFAEVERNWRELVGISEVGLSEEEEIFCLRLLETKVTHA